MSTTRLLRSSGLILAAAVALAGCSDRAPVAPSAPPPSQLLGLPLLRSQEVNVVTRAVPLAADISTGAWIGPLGGSLRIPEAGLSVIVPPGAVLSRTYFSATALKGNLVAYEFGPHGKTFLVPLIMTQSTNGLDLTNSLTNTLHPLQAGYFPSRDGIDFASATATVTELLGVKLDLNLGTATFTVGHFSGYLLASGRARE